MWTALKYALGDNVLWSCKELSLALPFSGLGEWSPEAIASVFLPKLSTLGFTQSASKMELCSPERSSDESTWGWKALTETFRRICLDCVVFAVAKAGDGVRAWRSFVLFPRGERTPGRDIILRLIFCVDDALLGRFSGCSCNVIVRYRDNCTTRDESAD